MTMMSTGFGSVVEPRGVRGRRRKRGALELAAQSRQAFYAGGDADIGIDSAGQTSDGGFAPGVDLGGAVELGLESPVAQDPDSGLVQLGGPPGERGILERAGDWINSKFDSNSLGGTLAGGLLGGVAGMVAGPVINAIGELNEKQIQDAIEKGNFNEKGELIGTGLLGETTAINAGPGPTGGGFRDDGSLSDDRSGGNVDMTGPSPTDTNTTPPPPTVTPRQTTVWDPQTRTFKPVLLHPDGRRTNADGTPLWRDGGYVSGLIDGETGGRADEVEADLPPGSYIIPATETSARGDGNTQAGALEIARDLGVDLNKLDTVRGGPVKARVAHGEFFVAPQDAKRNGGPGALDRYVMHLRRQHINKLKQLPRPQ